MSNPFPFDPQDIPWVDVDMFSQFVDLFGSQTIPNRYIVYFLSGCIFIYVLGWGIEYGQLHRFPIIGEVVSPSDEQMNVPKESRLGGVLVGLAYLSAEIITATVGGYGFGTFTLSIIYSILSYSALIVIIAVPIGAYLFYLNHNANETDAE